MSKSVFWKRSFETLIIRSWWVLGFIFISFVAFQLSLGRKNQEVALLEKHLYDLDKSMQAFLEKKQDLSLQIQSQSDPAWIELILMKGLGMVPKHHIKVHFTKDEILSE